MSALSRCPPISFSTRSRCPPDLRALTASARSRSPPAHGLRLRPLTASVHSRPPPAHASRSPLTVSGSPLCSRSPLAHDLRPLTASALCPLCPLTTSTHSPPPPAHGLRLLTTSDRSRPPPAHRLSACSRSPLAHGARTMSGLTVLYYTSESREVVGCKSRYLTRTKRVHKHGR